MKRTTSISPLSAATGALKPLLEIQTGSSSAGLVERALLLQALDRQLRQYLPDDMAGQCCLANVHPDKLVFLVTSSTWKARLRLHESELVTAARQCGLQIDRVIVKVATMQPVSPETASRKPLSNTAREHLRAAAQSIDDPQLRAQLLALASLP